MGKNASEERYLQCKLKVLEGAKEIAKKNEHLCENKHADPYGELYGAVNEALKKCVVED